VWLIIVGALTHGNVSVFVCFNYCLGIRMFALIRSSNSSRVLERWGWRFRWRFSVSGEPLFEALVARVLRAGDLLREAKSASGFQTKSLDLLLGWTRQETCLLPRLPRQQHPSPSPKMLRRVSKMVQIRPELRVSLTEEGSLFDVSL